jgi:hypothetical protein
MHETTISSTSKYEKVELVVQFNVHHSGKKFQSGIPVDDSKSLISPLEAPSGLY